MSKKTKKTKADLEAENAQLSATVAAAAEALGVPPARLTEACALLAGHKKIRMLVGDILDASGLREADEGA